MLAWEPQKEAEGPEEGGETKSGQRGGAEVTSGFYVHLNRAGAWTHGPTVTLLPPLPAAPKPEIQTWWRGQWRTLGPGDDSAGDAGTGGGE